MNLSLKQIAALSHGASYNEINDNKLYLHRLTREQENFFLDIDPSRLLRAECPSGITLEFTTTSRTLALSVCAHHLSGYDQSITIYANGTRINRAVIPSLATPTELCCHAELGEGKKSVVIRLPGISRLQILGLTVDDGATLATIPDRNTRLLLLGDSITQGYYTVDPEDSYAVRLGLALHAEVRNRAIGGDVFRPAYPLLRDDFEPDIISVAYGTNDWCLKTKDMLLSDCVNFFHNLKITYPHARIYALLPLWRKDTERINSFGQLHELNPSMRAAIESIGDIHVINCFDFLHQDPDLLTDEVHPSPEGHSLYADALISLIK